MKTAVILLVLLFTVDSYAQIFAKAQTSGEIKLEELLVRIKQDKQINLIYEPDLIEGKVIQSDLYDPDLSVETLLGYILSPVGLAYRKLDNNTFALRPAVLSGKEIAVNGKVTSAEEGEPIPGVNVLIRGTTTGVVTDIDGNYSIEVPSSSSVLVFSFIGYETQEIPVGSQTMINVTMEADIRELSEVVVTAVGIEANKSELGYSIHNLDPEDLVNSRETNISSALSAKIAGVQVISSSGSPGASATVRIRGNRSFGNTNGPLYVIDGLPIDNSTSANGTAGVDVSNRAIDINPNDIDKVTVLKGPAATVLYGSRAADGVIMITTKKGRVGKPVITLNTSFGISEVSQLPERQHKYAQGRPSGGVLEYRGPETGEAASYGPPIADLEFDNDPTYPYDQNGRLVPKGTGSGMPARAYDTYDAFWVKGHTIDNNLSILGGLETVRYYVSVGNLYQTGVVPNADFKRTSVKANIDADISSKFKVGVSSTYVNSGGYRIQRGSNVSGVTTGVFRNTPTFDVGNGKEGYDAADDPDTYSFPDGRQRAYRGDSDYDNPFWAVNRTPYEDDVDRVIGNLSLTYAPLDWLKFNYKIGVDRFTDARDFAWDINSSSERLGEVDQFIRTSNRVNSDFLVLINQKVNEDLQLNATLGHNYFTDRNVTEASEGTELAVPGFYHIGNASVIQSSKSVGQEEFYGVFADVKLNYRNYLFLNLSGRNDWASSLPEENNSFFYPAASVGFDFTEAFGLTQSTALPYGKLRVSYGVVGNAPPIYRTNTDFSNAVIDGDGLLAANEFPAFGVNGFERSGLLGNQALKPELTTSIEVGGDFKFMEGRLGLDLTYYHSSTSDAIVTTTLPAPSGYTDITLNSGEIENKGWEVALEGTPVRTKEFRWDSRLIFSRNRSEVLSIAAGQNSLSLAEFTAISSLLVVGQPYGILSGTRYRRNDAGQLIIGSDGWPLIADTQGAIGDPNPDWSAGFNNTFEYKSLSLSFLWDIRKGGDLWNGTKAVMDYLGVSKESGDDRDITGFVFDGVTESGEENTIPVDYANPALGLGGIKWRRAGTLLGLAEDNIEDGSWIRLREITLAYSLPASVFSNSKTVSGVDVSLYGRNLLLFTRYSGVDPETNLRGPSNAQGWDYFNLPGTKSYGISLQVVIK